MASSDAIIPALDGASDVPSLAAHLLAALPHRFALAGFSLGGIVAQQMAAQAPERVAKLCLIGTTPEPEPPGMAERRRSWVMRAREGGLEQYVANKLWPFYVSDQNRDDLALKSIILAMARDAGVNAYAAQTELILTSPDQRPALATLRICRPSSSAARRTGSARRPLHRDMAARIANSRFALIPGAGHFVTMERPDEAAAAMAAWL